MSSSFPSNILLVDDHIVVSKSVAELLKKRFDKTVFYFAYNGQQALEALSSSAIDIVLLDVSMPEMDGYQTLPQIKKTYPKVKVIMLTSHDSESLVLHFLEQGADGFLFKSDREDIAQVVQNVFEKGKHFSPKILELMEQNFQKKSQASKLPLSIRDRTLIRLIALGNSTKEIASRMNLGENTINSYRQVLMKQTNTRNTYELVNFAHKNGLMF